MSNNKLPEMHKNKSNKKEEQHKEDLVDTRNSRIEKTADKIIDENIEAFRRLAK